MGDVSNLDEHAALLADIAEAFGQMDHEAQKQLADYAAGLKAEQNRH